MSIALNLNYDEAVALRELLSSGPCAAAVEDFIEALTSAIDNEDERRYDRDQELLMESGGTDDSAYRRDMKDAGRGHLLR